MIDSTSARFIQISAQMVDESIAASAFWLELRVWPKSDQKIYYK